MSVVKIWEKTDLVITALHHTHNEKFQKKNTNIEKYYLDDIFLLETDGKMFCSPGTSVFQTRPMRPSPLKSSACLTLWVMLARLWPPEYVVLWPVWSLTTSTRWDTNARAISVKLNQLYHRFFFFSLLVGAIWPSLSPCTVINPILLTYFSLLVVLERHMRMALSVYLLVSANIHKEYLW